MSVGFGEALAAAERSEHRRASAVTVPRPALSSDVPPASPHPHVWTGGPRHGSQLRSPYRERTIDMLIGSDGAYCRAPVCNLGRAFGRAETLADLEGHPLPGTSTGCRFDVWTVDHIDGDNAAHWFDDERLTHWSCNNRTDKQHRSKRHSSRSSVSVYAPRPPMPGARDGFSAIKNAEAEPAFRLWVFRYLLKHRLDPPVPEDLVTDGAALVGANPVTVARWLSKMTAKIFGCLDDTGKNKAGQKVVQLKYAEDYSLTEEQLDAKYPWAGMRFAKGAPS